ncbi:MAG TPA: hypothetical protein VMH81_26830 [Bryobacteraceae bacterium]|nr:hypothetical protein [Bryobacteraceae bacterium]
MSAGLVLAPMASAQSPQKKATPRQESEAAPSQVPVPQTMAQAIAWEKFKDEAAARQARLEAKHPSVAYSDANRSAEEPQGRPVKDPGPRVKKDK